MFVRFIDDPRSKILTVTGYTLPTVRGGDQEGDVRIELELTVKLPLPPTTS